MSIVTMKTAGESKTHCLAPIEAARDGLFGCMTGSMMIHGNLVESTGESWDAEDGT